ncbi:MAG: nicotinate phosphoribosyltransferase [Desulfobacterota bacterium]|nr:nicotinate phosphoribosyltransferase [Thermodesulfobacteriota bacterium]MDW8001095.1 nicotinate phosphoribosyltransferase [Deltaproteobacteria bacterium]
MFFTASFEDIKKGKVTDLYFVNTYTILKKKNIDRYVKAEVIVKRLPEGAKWGVLSGVEELGRLIDGLNIKARCMREGTIFRPYEPVLEIEGMYTEFCLYETAILGLLCQSSGVATKAARCKKAAGPRPVISFGARRIHPVIAPMVERSAFIGGCDGVSVVFDAEMLGEEPMGTMPHALVLIFGDTVEATLAFDEIIDEKIKRISLIDTFLDEKVEAIRVAEALRGRLFGIRLDTPSSRRGDFIKILEEVRWELDIRGFKDVKIYVSGGIDENKILEMNKFVDAYGVGTSITNARVIDFAMDIVEIEGKPVSKKGKMSGSKRVLRCPVCYNDKVLPASTEKIMCECGNFMEDLLIPWYENKRFLFGNESPQEIRSYVLKQLEHFDL